MSIHTYTPVWEYYHYVLLCIWNNYIYMCPICIYIFMKQLQCLLYLLWGIVYMYIGVIQFLLSLKHLSQTLCIFLLAGNTRLCDVHWLQYICPHPRQWCWMERWDNIKRLWKGCRDSYLSDADWELFSASITLWHFFIFLPFSFFISSVNNLLKDGDKLIQRQTEKCTCNFWCSLPSSCKALYKSFSFFFKESTWCNSFALSSSSDTSLLHHMTSYDIIGYI